MMGGSEQEYSPEMKRRAFELRGQGVSFRAIANRLGEETGVAPPARTIANWCYSVAGRALIEHAKAQLAATLADRSNHALPRVYDALDDALERGDAKAVDALSRSVVNLTRGLIADKVEVTPGHQDTDDELLALLARHGVTLGGGSGERTRANGSVERPVR